MKLSGSKQESQPYSADFFCCCFYIFLCRAAPQTVVLIQKDREVQRQGMKDREGKKMRAVGKSLEKETKAVCLISFLLMRFVFLIGKCLRWYISSSSLLKRKKRDTDLKLEAKDQCRNVL